MDFSSFQDMFSSSSGIATIGLLFVSWLMGAVVFFRELIQLGRHFHQRGQAAEFYCPFSWLTFHVFTSFFLIIAIPMSQVFASDLRDNCTLTCFLAIGCILMWGKFLFKLRPLEYIGPIIAAIGRIARASLFLLMIAAFVVVGFSCSFFVLFR